MSELYTEQRPWGEFTVLLDAPDCKVKRITVKAGQRLSLQRHKYRSEKWVCISGKGLITLGKTTQTLEVVGFSSRIEHSSRSSVDISAGTIHRVLASPCQDLVFIEIQTGTSFEEDDITRYEDDFGRA